MFKVIALLSCFLLATALVCQTAPSPTTPEVRLVPVTAHDLYCSGFVTSAKIPNDHYLVAGWDSPNSMRYADGDYVYLRGSLPEGAVYSMVRELRNPDAQEFFPGQGHALSQAGSPYAEIGRVKIVAGNGKTSVAQITFSCDAFIPGDYAIPAQEIANVTSRHLMAFNRFPNPGSALRGRIVLAKDFQAYSGAGSAVYLNVGSDQGVKVGDYFRAVRGYGRHTGDAADRASYGATLYDATQKNVILTDASPLQSGGKHIHLADLPERALGELVVVNVTPKSSTAIVAFSLEDIQLGDAAYRDDLPAPSAAELASGTTAPEIACLAQPQTVRVGGATLISCHATSASGQPVALSFITDRGKLETGADHGAVLQTANLTPGQVHVTATATDDRNLKNTAEVVVNVEAASLGSVIQAPQPARPPQERR